MKIVKILFIFLVCFSLIALISLFTIHGAFTNKQYLELWEKSYPDKFDDPRLKIISHGLLAPSAHNMQSWKIKLDKENPLAFTLFMDSQRLLHTSDPYARQVAMSQGTFLTHPEIAAQQLGYNLAINLFPSGEFDVKGTSISIDNHPVAHVILSKIKPSIIALYYTMPLVKQALR